MLPEASAEGNIPTTGEQHARYIAEHITIDLLYHYHLDNMYACVAKFLSLSSVLCMGSHGWEMGVVWGFLG